MASKTSKHRNFESPNWETDGQLFLVRCFDCEPERGRENYGPVVARGYCAWCGWSANASTEEHEAD